MENEFEITLEPGKFSEVIHKKSGHNMYAALVQGEGFIIQLDFKKFKGKHPKIKLEPLGELTARLEGERFKIIASPKSSESLQIVFEQRQF